MSATSYVLEHFYYGQFVRDDQPYGDLRLLAASPGIKSEQVAEAVRLALLPPLPGAARGAWALVRGRQAVPFVLVQSQLGAAGQSMLHFIIAQPDMLRAVGGNLRALMRLVEDQLPTYDRLGDALRPLELPQTEAPSAAEQIDNILELMSYTGNRVERIEALLAAIVQGVPLYIQDAPPDLETRVRFVQGLLALLPPSARFGVTFATHSLASSHLDVQVCFAADGAPEKSLVFQWSSGQIAGAPIEDAYSRFIASQLRLDAELVIQRTRQLTAVAAWRIKLGDRLADALGYAANRFKLDEALLTSQPVGIEDVARVLAEDPTLSDELKVAYVQHLLAFSLALGDMSQANPIAVMLRQQPRLEQAVQAQLSDAIAEGKAGLVYETLSRWLANPLGPVGMTWVDLTHRAALAHMQTLVDARDSKAVNQFLEAVHRADAGVEVSRMVARLIEMALPLTVRDADLSLTLFLLAVNYLESDVLRRFLSSQRFTAQLPPSLARLAPYVTGSDPGLCPAGLLVDTAAAFGDEWRDLVLIRLAEAALMTDRPDVVDTTALAGLVQLLPTPWAVQYSQVLHWIARNLSRDDLLRQLDPPGPTYLLQLLLASGAYVDLANEMLHQARVLYPGDAQTDYVAVVRRIFAETPIPTENIPVALKVIGETGIRSLPLAMAYIGALEGHEWAAVLDAVAEEATHLIFDNPAILEVIDPSAMIALLKFHIKRRDAANTIRVAGMVAQVAARDRNRGTGIIGRMYKMMDWDDKVRLAGLELMRRYVRHADDEEARRAVTVFGREFGPDVQAALGASYALRQALDGLDVATYAELLHVTADFLYDTALAYADKNRVPSVSSLLSDLDSMGGGLTDDERLAIVREMLGLARAVIVLGGQQLANYPRNLSRHIEGLLTGKTDPATTLDVLWVLGGYFTKGKRYPLRLQAPLVPHPLAERSAPRLREESAVVNSLLRALLRAFPLEKRVAVSAAALRGEIESLWGDLPLIKRRELVRNLAIDLQRVAELATLIVEAGNIRALEDNTQARRLEENRMQPKNTLEFYRFVAGYFKARAS